MSHIVKLYVDTNYDITIPVYAKEGDSGKDVRAKQDYVIRPGETTIVGTGLYLGIPSYAEIQVRPRSGLSYKTKLRIANSPGTVDSNYREELGIIVDNIGEDEIRIKAGDRIAQIVLVPVLQFDWSMVDTKEALGTTERTGGFGSTGIE